MNKNHPDTKTQPHEIAYSKPTITFLYILLVGLLGSLVGCSKKAESVEMYRTRVIDAVNTDLARPDNAIRKRIEAAHVTVTAKSAKVTACTVRTVDGSSIIGQGGSNLADIDLIVTVFWDGWVEKNGYTEFRILYDCRNNQTKEVKYLKSSALINMETVDWFGVGFKIGSCIALLL
jgi:hypothetical protein